LAPNIDFAVESISPADASSDDMKPKPSAVSAIKIFRMGSPLP
jgi:hypothetical protein